MRCVYVVVIEVPAEAEQAWSDWQTGVHVPAVLAQPGFLGARKLKDVERTSDGRARYLMEYLLESRAAFETYRQSDAAAQLRREHEEHFGKVVRISRQVLEEEQSW